MARNVKTPLAACLICWAGLGLLTLFALGLEAGRHLDVRLFLGLAENPRADAGGVAEALAALADLLPMLAMLTVACGVALIRRRPGDALAALFVVAGANVTTQLLKALLAHPRVKTAIGGNPFEPNTFPSGHTTAAASIAIAYALVVPAALRNLTLALGAGFVLAVGCSVVAIGWHYPSDVLGAYLIAAGWGFAALAAMRVIAPRGGRGVGVSPRTPLPSP
ncbi:MAG TPA: phosphatase PAP2 family protein [Solirubrobacterales bacterium]|nr:phosphatase PAP2 family protein [Solirubrobacterales bacterium]